MGHMVKKVATTDMDFKNELFYGPHSTAGIQEPTGSN